MQKLLKVWNLQLFAEGTEAGPAEGSPNDTGETTEVAAQELGETTEVATQNEVTENPETERESFSELIKGEYKDEFNKKVTEIVKKRVKNYQKEIGEAKSQLETTAPVIELLMEKYNTDSVEDLVRAVLDDDAMYEEEAMKNNMDVDTYKFVRNMKRENERLKEREEDAKEQAKMQEHFDRINAQAEEAKQIYPNLDIEEEMENDFFRRLIWAGADVQNAYETVHNHELEALKAKAIADTTAKKVAASIKANKKRPAENGLSQTAGTKVTKDPSSLTADEIEKLYDKAESGISIGF